MYDTRPWLKQYPKGVPANIDDALFNNITDFLDDVFSRYPGKDAFYCMGKSLTYKEVDQMSRQFGSYLQSRGLKPGDKFALMMPSILQYPIGIFGVFRAGLVAVNINPLYTEHEMLHQIQDSDCKGILILENFAQKLEHILPKTSIEVVVTTSIGELLGFIKGSFIDFAIRNFKKMVPPYDITNAVRLKESLKLGKKTTLQTPVAQLDDLLILQYTGGTTGVSKGAMLSHRNLLANMEQIKVWFLANYVPGEELCLSPLPLYHIFAFSVNMMAFFSMNVPSVFIPNPRDMSTIIKAFKKYDITIMTGVNTLFNALLNNGKFRDLDFKLKGAIAGGMALQRYVAENWKELTGTSIIEGYGLSESSPVATCNPCDGTERLGTIGVPVPSTEIKIVDDENREVPVGEKGEICIRGPQVMMGYYNKPEETSKTLIDGWLHTGDIGIMEESGFLRIVDRKKDMILVSGFNVFPNEIEDVLVLHPKVSEACVVGVPDEKSTEAVKAFLVKGDPSLTEKEIRAHCDQYLTGYKKPKYVEFIDELPKTPVGKILRRALRDNEDSPS